ncbi:hypothetical protein HCN44_007982 [Aphidius gifuensis]|uniref:Mitochondrial import receptor subunit TOM20 homolog n=1 Tax=Aphidius gifuensis TaxID=684658 RepID=A0A834XLC1_APHGI|nr:hypothetical protein HCN44_007982 [Aphidius gifuensis]
MISKTAMGIAVGIASAVVGYCIYFDKQRRNDPDFKKKLRERRKNKKQASKCGSEIPDLTDPELVQKFFLQEVQLGEELLAAGDLDGGIEHLANAVAVCGQPRELLSVLQKTLPPQVFHLLVQRLPSVGNVITNRISFKLTD